MRRLEFAAAARRVLPGMSGGAGTWLSRNWREMLLVAASVIGTYCALDIGYRIYQYETLPDRLFRLGSSLLRGNAQYGQLRFDEHTGYAYAPLFEGHSGPPFNARWRTNSHGHVSEVEYPRHKPSDEYRIAVIGDSMTANTQNNVRWTELVERQLNAAPKWRAFVGGRSTRVINFGVHMMGIVQFDAMLRYHAFDFEPDLIIVNFISDDIRRRLVFPMPPTVRPDTEDKLRLYIATNILYQIRWFRFYPELLAATAGQYLHLRCLLPLDERLIWAQSLNNIFTETSEAISASAAAVRDMIALARTHQRPILFLQQPQSDELDELDSPHEKWLVDAVGEAAPGLRVVDMRPRMAALLDGKRLKDRPDLAGMARDAIMQLPDSRKLEIYRWFYLPVDWHYTDYGTTLYGGQVAAYLIDASAAGFGTADGRRP